MIRKADKNDLERIMEIWLETNLLSHYFIPNSYWISNYKEVKIAIAQAEVYVYEVEDVICGFIGLINSYIAGIFVEKMYQSQGIGRLLLKYIKENHSFLSLHVYEKNERALNFYVRENFKVIAESKDMNTGEKEIEMKWSVN